ncbi:MAG: lipoyl(octanoyl) transferase LipB [Candidatus Omnitrophota bacterium]
MRIIDLGITDFLEAYRIQTDMVKEVSQGTAEDTLLLTEHRSVITIGRSGSWDNILKPKEYLSSRGIEVLDIDRGGDVTYHGPGQVIAYPIFKLEKESRAIHYFLHFLEEIAMHFLGQYGLIGETRPGFRGIWIRERKIASIGIGVKKWVTYHGLAINVNLDLTPFSFIRPCGIEGLRMTTLKDLLAYELDIDDAKHRLRLSFKEVPFLADEVCKG